MAADSRQVIAALLRREIPVRMGLNESFWPFICENAWAAQGVPAKTDFVQRFDLDLACVHWYSPPAPRPDLACDLAETDEWIERRSGWGEVTRTWKTKAGTPEHVGFAITSPEVWFRDYRDAFLARDPAEGVDFADIRRKVEARRREGRFVTYSFMFVFEWMRKVLGDVTMLESLLLDKDFIHDFNRLFTGKFLAFYQRLFREVGKPDGIHLYEDLGYTQAAFCSPECHREMVHPYHCEMFRFFKEQGLPVIVHTCGDFRPHLPALVEAGTDCIQALEAKTGMDVVALAREWKDRLCFMGNIDVRPLESGDPKRIEAEVLAKVEGMRRLRAPYIAMSDHSIPPSVTVASYERMLDLIRRHCRY